MTFTRKATAATSVDDGEYVDLADEIEPLAGEPAGAVYDADYKPRNPDKPRNPKIPNRAAPGYWDPTDDKRAQLIDLVAQGVRLPAALEQMGMTRNAYKTWRRRYPAWTAKLDTARGVDYSRQPPELVELTDKSSFADKRYAYFGFQTYWHHHRIIDAIESAPAAGITLILVPPEHGKSTLLADYISVRIGENPNLRVAYVSEGLGLARKACGRQQRRMEADGTRKHPRYHATFGPFHEEGRDTRPWTKDFFTVVKADHDEQDYTFEARGWTSAIAGSRVDLLVVDDIQSLRSLSQTTDMLETFRQDFLSRVGREGKVIVIGTRVGEADIYQALIDADLIDKLVMLPATEGEIADCPHGDRCDLPQIPHEKPLCPEMWPVHDLARKRKQVGESAWWRNYQQKPRNARDATFTESMIADARNTLETLSQVALRAEKGWRRFAALDPAIRGGNSLIGVEANGVSLRVVGLSRQFDMVRAENILDDIDRCWKMWRYTDLIIEVNAYQKALGNDERLRNLSRLRGFRIHQHTTGVNKLDQDFGVARMASMFLDRQVEWPYGDEQSKATMGTLEAELLSWREGVPTRKLRQDTVMSLWFAWLFWQKRRQGWLEDDYRLSPNVRRQGVPWAVQGYDAVRALARGLAS